MKKIQYRRELWKVIKVKGGAAEIGVAEGYFSANMLGWTFTKGNGMQGFPIVYMVDRWKETPRQSGDASMPQIWHDGNLQQAILRTEKFGDRAKILRGPSVEMADEVPDHSLAFVYIDGDHSYEGVLADINAWYPKVVKGGVMAFHDYENPNYGVKSAVNDFVEESSIQLIPEDKPEDAGAWFIC